ncbi:hypothetical protein [Bacillus cereus]|uniref:Uncharacterized protein n=1 Tax=Bacillus cereus TaxID=1396 RepID=A0A2A8ZXJ6_BACCE|nr:hypothetical protein [Bacillus cereus]PFE13333.1 hypothetical protein CN307_18050 [Bacillus cereus]
MSFHESYKRKIGEENKAENSKLIVNCTQGKLVGTLENMALALYNLPYGSDQGRFMPVGEPDKWSGSRDATKPVSIFPQSPSSIEQLALNKRSF